MPDEKPAEQDSSLKKFVSKSIAFRREQVESLEQYCRDNGITRKDGTPAFSDVIRTAVDAYMKAQGVEYPEIPFEFGGKRENSGRPKKKRRRSHTPDSPPTGSTMA